MTVYQDTFNTDYDKLLQDSVAYQQMVQAQADAVTAYQAAYKKLMRIKDPMQVFIALIYLLSVQGFNQFDTTLSTSGASLQVQGDMTKLGNDIENMSNQNSTDPQLVKDMASHLDKLLDTLDASSGNQGVLSALGSDASSAIYQNDLTLRQYIYMGDGDKYDPAKVPNPQPGERTYYFDVSSDPDTQDYMQTFAQMQANMSKQGDPYDANIAAKGITDNSNMNQQTTSSTNQASTAAITNEKNIISSVQSFVVDMMHAQSDTIKATIQAPK